jgi:nitrogen fixation/metabolism regulation signal transduction histidine kinase
MIRAIILACVTLGIALIALMFRASSNNAVFEQQYPSLFWLGLALTIGLLLLIGTQIYSLVKRVRGRVFGSKLALRLMAVFVLMAIIPGGLVYAISVQFLNRSIDSWFDVPVDRSFESALNLARSALEASAGEAARRTREAALRATEAEADSPTLARQLRQQFEFDEVVVLNSRGDVEGFLGMPDQRVRLMPDKPTPVEVSDAINKSTQRITETLGERAIYFRVLVRVPATADGKHGVRVIQTMQAAPSAIVGDLQSVDVGVRDYQRLGLLRSGLKQVFALTLTLAMVLTVFSAISLSFLISDRLAAPLSALAESTRAIAKGDFTKLNPVKSRDEFGVLTQSFNTMTRQLGEASDVVARKQRELETANAYLESILGNLTSGVVTLDERLYVKSINRVASDMLGIQQSMLKGSPFSSWASLYPGLQPLIDEVSVELLSHATSTPERSWEKQLSILSGPETKTVSPAADAQGPATTSNNTMQMRAPTKRSLLVRGTRLSQSVDGGFVIVIDDVTNLIQAQRDAAWGEVARRLAHEIKNPLTPIQLSAERLQMKLADKLPDAEREMLSRATHTIVAQVGALKGMVDDFSLYSRASRMKPGPVDINELTADVLALYQSMPIKLRTSFASDLPTITADPALLRQVIHNLMQNAQDALQQIENATVDVITSREGEFVSLVIRDNGIGVRDDVKARIFEPYVTTKAKGTGLGLAIVKKIMDEHRGRISVEPVSPTGSPTGTAVTLYLPLVHQPPQSVRGSAPPNSV